MKGGAPSGWIRSTSSEASSLTFASTASSTDLNSATVPSWMFRNEGITPIPSGSSRMNSSNDPGRMVGLTTPTTPRQLVNDTAHPSYNSDNFMLLPPDRRVPRHRNGPALTGQPVLDGV